MIICKIYNCNNEVKPSKGEWQLKEPKGKKWLGVCNNCYKKFSRSPNKDEIIFQHLKMANLEEELLKLCI